MTRTLNYGPRRSPCSFQTVISTIVTRQFCIAPALKVSVCLAIFTRRLQGVRYPTAQHHALDEMIADGILNLYVKIWGSRRLIGIILELISARQLMFICRADFWSIPWCLNRSMTFRHSILATTHSSLEIQSNPAIRGVFNISRGR